VFFFFSFHLYTLHNNSFLYSQCAHPFEALVNPNAGSPLKKQKERCLVLLTAKYLEKKTRPFFVIGLRVNSYSLSCLILAVRTPVRSSTGGREGGRDVPGNGRLFRLCATTRSGRRQRRRAAGNSMYIFIYVNVFIYIYIYVYIYRYQEMAYYFVYAQLRAQGEDSVEERQVILCIYLYM